MKAQDKKDGYDHPKERRVQRKGQGENPNIPRHVVQKKERN